MSEVYEVDEFSSEDSGSEMPIVDSLCVLRLVVIVRIRHCGLSRYTLQYELKTFTSKLLGYGLENFLRTCLEVLSYFA